MTDPKSPSFNVTYLLIALFRYCCSHRISGFTHTSLLVLSLALLRNKSRNYMSILRWFKMKGWLMQNLRHQVSWHIVINQNKFTLPCEFDKQAECFYISEHVNFYPACNNTQIWLKNMCRQAILNDHIFWVWYFTLDWETQLLSSIIECFEVEESVPQLLSKSSITLWLFTEWVKTGSYVYCVTQTCLWQGKKSFIPLCICHTCQFWSSCCTSSLKFFTLLLVSLHTKEKQTHSENLQFLLSC